MSRFSKISLFYIILCIIAFYIKNSIINSVIEDQYGMTDNQAIYNSIIGLVTIMIEVSIAIALIVGLLLISYLALKFIVAQKQKWQELLNLFFHYGATFIIFLGVSEILKLLTLYLFDHCIQVTSDPYLQVFIPNELHISCSVTDITCIISGIVFFIVELRQNIKELSLIDAVIAMLPFIIYFGYVHYTSLNNLITNA